MYNVLLEKKGMLQRVSTKLRVIMGKREQYQAEIFCRVTSNLPDFLPSFKRGGTRMQRV